MISLLQLLRQISDLFSEFEIAWALVGGLAIGARVEPRFTRDVDVVVDVQGDEEAELVVHSLLSKGYRIAAVLEQAKSGRLATVRLLPPNDARLIDVLFASSGIESQIVQAASSVNLGEGVTSPVAAVGHLIAMKVLARDDVARPQDRLDLLALLKTASADDLELASTALKDIAKAGLDRGRDLITELSLARREFGLD